MKTKPQITIFVFLIAGLFISSCGPLQVFGPTPTPTPTITLTPTPTATPKSAFDLVFGFIQLPDPKDSWYLALASSIQSEAQIFGFQLRFKDSKNQQDQIKIMRAFIADRVDVIGIAPDGADGWDQVFQEAQTAGIPVIVVNNLSVSAPQELFTYAGLDLIDQGKKAAMEMARLFYGQGNIVELQGISSTTVSRGKGFSDTLQNYPGLKIIDSRIVNWGDQAGGLSNSV